MSRAWLRTRVAVSAAVLGLSATACSGAPAQDSAPSARPSTSVHPSTNARTGGGRPGLTAIGTTLYVGWAGSRRAGAAAALNLGWSTDGGRTLTTLATDASTAPGEGPALDNDGHGVFIAWTDGAHTLNLAYYNGTTLTCRTTFTGVTSPYSPALANDGSGARYLAWADEKRHLNFARVESAACGSLGAMRLTGRNTAPNTTIAGPALVYDTTSAGLGLVVAWVGTDSAHEINVASYVSTTVLAHRATLVPNPPAASTSAPGLAAAVADLYLEFRGTDGTLYTAYSEGCIPSCFTARPTGALAGSGVGMTGGDHTWTAYFDRTGALVITGF